MIRTLREPGFVICLLLLVLGTASLTGAVNAFKLYLRKLPIDQTTGLLLILGGAAYVSRDSGGILYPPQ